MRKFEHVALLYDGLGDLVAKSVAYIRAGLERDEPVLVLVPADHLVAIREGLGADTERVRFGDMGTVGRNPGAIISQWSDFVDEHQGRRVRGIGEPIWAGRTDEELVECHRHEGLINLAFADANASILCPYDVSSLAVEVVEEAFRTHPVISDGGDHIASEAHFAARRIEGLQSESLSTPPADASALDFDVTTIDAVRRFVQRSATDAGLPISRIEDLVLAVNEVAINTVRHGSAQGYLQLWQEPNRLIIDIHDQGHIQDPLVGRMRPDFGAESGYGLWLVNQLCDLVQVRDTDSGLNIRLSVLLESSGLQ